MPRNKRPAATRPAEPSWGRAIASLFHPHSNAEPLDQARRSDDANGIVSPATRRLPLFDVLRGVAIIAMVAFHLAFDLNYFGIIRADFYTDNGLVATRNAIVAAFLLLVGISMTLALRNGIHWDRYLKRLLLLVLCALAVSLGSWLIFPQSWIFFGVLHFIAAASLIALLFRRFYRANLFLGLALIFVGLTLAHPLFDARGWSWIGLVTTKPITEDYVPLLPWFGVVLIGMFLGKLSLRRIDFAILAERQPTTRVAMTLAWMGRHSLAIYLLHQPLLFAAIWLVVQILAPTS